MAQPAGSLILQLVVRLAGHVVGVQALEGETGFQHHRTRHYRGPMLRRLVARAFWSLSPWRLSTVPAPDRPTVLIGAPHTSNWDFVLMLGITWRLGMDIRWLGKHSLFRGWRGPLMRALGGIAVDRSNAGGVVEEVVERVRSGEVFGLVVTPDGTRGGHTHWKSG